MNMARTSEIRGGKARRRVYGGFLLPLPAALFVLSSLVSTPAHAYIEPGTAGMLLQLLLGGAAGALVIVKLYWYRFKEGVQRIFGGGPKSGRPSDRESGN